MHPQVVAQRIDAARAALRALTEIDPTTLNEETQLDLAVGFGRLRNSAAAGLGRTAGSLAATTPDNLLHTGAGQAAAELGPALGIGSRSADRLVDIGMSMRDLPQTTATALAGELSWDKVAILAEQTLALTPEQMREVESQVLPKAATRSPAQHKAAVRRAVERIDPDALQNRREHAERVVALVRDHVGDGMGQLIAHMPSEDLELVWLAADAWAREQKANGDPRTLDQLRVASIVTWARQYLREHAPHRHGRPLRLTVLWDLRSLLDLSNGPGETADGAAVLPYGAVRKLVEQGVHLRRMVIDLDTGELLDLTPISWRLGPYDGSGALPPVELRVIIDLPTWQAIQRNDPAVHDLLDALASADPAIREMLAHPLTADDLDRQPDAETPSAALAEFVNARYRHPANPAAGTSAAASGDLDHIVPRRRGGSTTRGNLHPPTRRWHLLRTHGGWTLRRDGRDIIWISPLGKRYRVEPHDYRLGP